MNIPNLKAIRDWCLSKFQPKGDYALSSDIPTDMTGATTTTTGTSGLVPAPAVGDNTKYLRGDGTWSEQTATVDVLDTLEEIEANTEAGKIAGALAAKEMITRIGFVLEGTLTAGATSITFTDPAITEDSLIDIYTTIYGVDLSEAPVFDAGTNTLTLTFDAQEEDMEVKVIVR